MAPLYTTSTTSMKSWEVLKLPMNLVWSGVLEGADGRERAVRTSR